MFKVVKLHAAYIYHNIVRTWNWMEMTIVWGGWGSWDGRDGFLILILRVGVPHSTAQHTAPIRRHGRTGDLPIGSTGPWQESKTSDDSRTKILVNKNPPRTMRLSIKPRARTIYISTIIPKAGTNIETFIDEDDEIMSRIIRHQNIVATPWHINEPHMRGFLMPTTFHSRRKVVITNVHGQWDSIADVLL